MPTEKLNPLFVGIDLVPSLGGPYKSIDYFRQALGGRAVSFTNPRDISEATEKYIHIRAGDNKIARAFLWPNSRELAKADELLSGVNLLSVHILFRYSAHWVASRARRNNIPYWIVPHGCLDPYVFTYRAGIKKIWMRLFGQKILDGASAVIFSTAREKEKASRWLSRNNGHVVSWPVDLPSRKSETELRHAWRTRLGFRQADRVLLVLGRLHTMKRPLQVLEAIAGSKTPNIRAVFIGPKGDVDHELLAAKATQLGIKDKITVLPPAYGEDKESALWGCDGLISLSVRENFNNSAAEAMAAGRPVILSPGNDLGHELGDKNCALLLSSDAVEEVSYNMRVFAAMSDDSLKKLGSNARVFAKKKLAFSEFKFNLENLARMTQPA